MVLEGEGGSKKRKKNGGKTPRKGPNRYEDPSALKAACFLCVCMPLALVAWQVLAVERVVRTRGSLASLSGRASALESHFYVR